MSTTYVRLDKVIHYVLGTTLSAVMLYLIFSKRASLLNHKRWVAIVCLSALTAFLLWLIGAIKRFHERTVAEMRERHKSGFT